jgi:hypothetical protein
MSNKASGEPGGRAWDAAEAARPDRCLQVRGGARGPEVEVCLRSRSL